MAVAFEMEIRNHQLQFHVLQKAVICCKPADLRSLFALRNPFSLLFMTFTLPQLIPMINAFSPFV